MNSQSAVKQFRTQIIAAKETGSLAPIQYIGGFTFLLIRQKNCYLVAITKKNVNPSLGFEYLYQLHRILVAYLGEAYTENDIRNHFTLIYELLEETMDFGYPQNCSIDVLKMYVNLATLKDGPKANANALTSQITGAIDWRRDGIRYADNEVYLDIFESVNLLLSTDGTILKSDVAGKVMMRSLLSGMPECKIGLNDKLVMEQSGKMNNLQPKKGARTVAIEDCTFHRCVRLGKFDTDRSISFIPPDGDFELMRYRITESVNLPFKFICTIQEEGKTRVSINLKISAAFPHKLYASNVTIKIPVPNNTARCKLHVPIGKAKHKAAEHAILWKIRKFHGESEQFLTGDVELIQVNKQKQWSRPPITMEFNIPMYTASGLHIRFLKVFEKNSYSSTKWVRYITNAGEYQVRI